MSGLISEQIQLYIAVKSYRDVIKKRIKLSLITKLSIKYETNVWKVFFHSNGK
jgi:hypothetical protein